MHKKYFYSYLILVFIFALPLLHNFLLLKKMGDFEPDVEIYKKQAASSGFCAYGSGIYNDAKNYKLSAYNIEKPDLIALGSSRALEFRQEFFKPKFYNMGFTVASVPDAERMVAKIMSIHKPKQIIMNVDFWWFNDKAASNYGEDLKLQTTKEIELGHLSKPIKWLKQGTMSLAQYIQLPYQLSDSKCGFGIKGYFQNAGYGADGSYYYSNIITGSSFKDKIGVQTDYQFTDVKKRINQGIISFEHQSKANEKAVSHFISLAKMIRAEGIDLILFFPPLPDAANSLMEKYDYGYIVDLKNHLKQSGVDFYDYTNPQTVNSTDCEFVDGQHAGDVTYAKMLLDIAKTNKNLAANIKADYLRSVTEKYAGLAAIPNSAVTERPEIDFLGLGCKK
jgi:hypothetical protein